MFLESGVRLTPFAGPLFESEGMYNITVVLTGEISTPASVDVVDEDGNAAITIMCL